MDATNTDRPVLDACYLTHVAFYSASKIKYPNQPSRQARIRREVRVIENTFNSENKRAALVALRQYITLCQRRAYEGDHTNQALDTLYTLAGSMMRLEGEWHAFGVQVECERIERSKKAVATHKRFMNDTYTNTDLGI